MQDMNLSNPDTLLRLHDQAVREGRWPDEAAVEDAATRALLDNHRCNIALWEAEDQARRRDMPDAFIVQCKREIDRHNQQRNDAVERLDEALLQSLAGRRAAESARLHSETPGAIVDRLSILSLKIFHMGAQARRTDATAEHLATCDAKLQRLIVQRADLAGCLGRLWREIEDGAVYFKVYRQFKMYNDPALNPWLQAGVGRGPATCLSRRLSPSLTENRPLSGAVPRGPQPHPDRPDSGPHTRRRRSR